MFIYQPTPDSKDRVVWYGEPNQLQYQTFCNGEWVNTELQLREVPMGMSEVYDQIVDCYNYCNIIHLERRMAMAD